MQISRAKMAKKGWKVETRNDNGDLVVNIWPAEPSKALTEDIAKMVEGALENKDYISIVTESVIAKVAMFQFLEAVED